jgi:hypothetical protein
MCCVVAAWVAIQCPKVLLSMPKQTSPDGKQSLSRSARKRDACKARFEEESDWKTIGIVRVCIEVARWSNCRRLGSDSGSAIGDSPCDKRSNLMRWNCTDQLAATRSNLHTSDCYQARDPDVELVTATIVCQRASSSCLFCC